MVHHLRGMFAFALWDSNQRELFLARDRAGEKPLYFTQGIPGGGFGFASEMKALLAAGVSTDPDFDALAEYLYHLYIPAPRSAFASISKLPPGHFLGYRSGEVDIQRYWEPKFAPVDRTEAEHVDGLREYVVDAVCSRLVADVAIGAFLSGGIDSSSVVAAMCATHDKPVHTFTITFEGHGHYDESEAARATARHFRNRIPRAPCHARRAGPVPADRREFRRAVRQRDCGAGQSAVCGNRRARQGGPDRRRRRRAVLRLSAIPKNFSLRTATGA
jgi:asparagine synthase (glutamine-hydrolysing)